MNSHILWLCINGSIALFYTMFADDNNTWHKALIFANAFVAGFHLGMM